MPGAFIRGWHGLGTGEIKQINVNSAGGWLTQFFTGFVKTVLIAGYTALTVAELVKQSGTVVANFQEAIAARYRFCANANIIPSIIAQYPEVGQSMVGVPKNEAREAPLLPLMCPTSSLAVSSLAVPSLAVSSLAVCPPLLCPRLLCATS